jgi:ABC-2 type transport system permease protein
MSSAFAYTRYELLRTFRNRRFFVFSIGFPVVLYFLIAGPSRNDQSLRGTGISAPLYYMVGLTSFGTMAAMISSGVRIAGERTVGWTRQLRITPLSPRAYFRAKVLTAYAMAGLTIVLLDICGLSLGVSIPASQWLEMTGLMLVGLLPFAALGITLGHLMNVDSIGPLTGGLVSLLALVSGTWFPITSGILYDVGQLLPSYWLVQAAHVGIGGSGWGVEGWAVVAFWTVLLAITARFAYRRDTERV